MPPSKSSRLSFHFCSPPGNSSVRSGLTAEPLRTTLMSAPKVPGDENRSAAASADPTAVSPSRGRHRALDSGVSFSHHHGSSATGAGRGGRLSATFSLSYIIFHDVPGGQLVAGGTSALLALALRTSARPSAPPFHTHLFSAS